MKEQSYCMVMVTPPLDTPTHTHTLIRGLPKSKPDSLFFSSGLRDAAKEYTQLDATWRLAQG